MSRLQAGLCMWLAPEHLLQCRCKAEKFATEVGPLELVGQDDSPPEQARQ